MGYRVAVVGATGLVGREMASILEERKFPVDSIRLFASERSKGEIIPFDGKEIAVEVLDENSFDGGCDFAFFSAGKKVSLEYGPIAAKAGVVVIDNSSAWRMDDSCPLVVPEVNSEALREHKGIIANPNCSTIQMLVALKPIHDVAGIKRIVVTTFQSVSGTGKKAIEELLTQVQDVMNFKEAEKEVYPYQIAFNVLPQIGSFLPEGDSEEELKMVNETHKILDKSIKVCATTVRVPVVNCHSESVNIELGKKLTANEARALMASWPGITVYDAPDKNIYPLPLDTAGSDNVFVGRVREDNSVENGLNLWIVADNLRKGAALNAIQIAEKMIEMGLK